MIISNLPIDLGRVKQNYSTDNENRPLLMSGVAGVSSTSDRGSNESVVNNSIYANPSTGTIHANISGNVTGSSGSCTGNAATATQFSANKAVTLTGDVTGTASSKAGWSVATTLVNSGVTAGTYGPSADVTGNNNATISVPEITVDAKGRVTSVTNRTLTCKNNTYTVNNATLTIQKNGTTVKTFTANASANVTANITVPTKTSDLTNDSHVSITTEEDTTSTGTPAHGGTFTCIDSVTRDSNGHVTKVNTKTVTLPSDSNTDTLVTQNVSTANENHPILLSVTKDATTNQGAKTSIFASGVKVNPSTGTVTATAFSGNLTGNVTGNISGSSGSCTGNAATATKLKTARTINGTNFDGSGNITTANWGTARNISIQDHNAGHTSSAVSVNGSGNVNLKLPSTINADIDFPITEAEIEAIFNGTS
jgi:hypothetical protein